MASNSTSMIDEVIQSLNLAARTRQSYAYELTFFASWLRKFYGECNLENLTQIEVQSYIDWLREKKYSAHTIGVKFSAIHAFCRVTGQSNICMHVKVPSVTRNTVAASLSRIDRLRLIRNVERDGSCRNIAIVKMLLFSGIRVSELCALDVDDVACRERSGYIRVRHGKGDKERRIAATLEVRQAVTDYLLLRGNPEDRALFLSNRQTRIKPRTVQHILARYGTHPHALRHTYCRMLVDSGVDLVTVAALAGHSDIQTTAIYAKPSLSDLENAVTRAFMGSENV